MALAMAYAIAYARKASSQLQRFIVYLLLSMMNSMLIGPLFYYMFKISIVRAAEVSAFAMMIEVIPFLGKFLSDVMNERSGSKTFLYIYTGIFVILDEIIMSLDFNLISGLQNSLNLYSVIYSLSSYWFVFPMAFEMFLSAFLLRKDINKFMIIVFSVQAAVMLLMPVIFSGFWVPVSIYLSGAIMTGFFIYMFEHLYRKQSISSSSGRYIIWLLTGYSLMMGSIFLWQYNGSLILISISMIIYMSIYLNGILRYSFNDKKFFWIANRRWSLIYMIMVFVSEFFMGATFDAQYYGATPFISSMNLAAVSGTFYNIMASSLYDFIAFFGITALSTWFLIMMGIEMGSLVVFRLKSAHPENRIRLILMLCAYAIYSVLIPSFIIPNNSKIPFIGWSMGIGSGGPVAPDLIIPIVLTYVISGLLSFFFGSRQMCSVFCTAPVMYQGTFYDSMKKFNRSGKISKSITLSNRSGKLIYRIISLMVYSSIGMAAVISFLDSIHVTSLYIYGTDPEYMLYIFYFGVLWYLVFITMPVLGSYACINTGYCHWGNFNRFISRFGFFRLKVKDPSACLTCKTKDCATACPVGNHEMPGSFIKNGYYKDSRCIGIGDCLEACPNDNIFFYDVRQYLRKKITKNENLDATK
ncbi:4Fe-4S binding protein [Picrophilus oshimae]|nr:4Fe-4S dicluster domain-containing protein [Picrophilus oshimae]